MISDAQHERMRNEVRDALFIGEKAIGIMDNNSIIVPFDESDTNDYRLILENNIASLKTFKETDDLEEFRKDVQTIGEISNTLLQIRMIIMKHYFV